MTYRQALLTLTITTAVAVLSTVSARAQETPPPMSFFITSVGPGNGADLGGLAGADAYCQSLAAAVGADPGPWRAYLSAAATDEAPSCMPGTASARAPGTMPRGCRWPPMWTSCTVTTI